MEDMRLKMAKYNTMHKIRTGLIITGLAGLLSLGAIRGCDKNLDSKCGREINKGIYRVMNYEKDNSGGYEDGK